MKRRRHLRIGTVLTASALLAAVTLCAQTPSPQERAAAIKESLAANQAALKQYTWVETTTISLKGEVKKQEQKQCSYGADGKVQKTPIPGATPQPKQQQEQSKGRRGGGRAKEAIVEKKVDDLKDYMERAAALVHAYVPPDPQKIQAAQAANHVSTQPSGNVVTMTITDYLQAGDSLAIGFNTTDKQLATYNVNSYVEKPKDDVLTLGVTFGRLADGTSYPQQILLDVKSKNVLVKVVNSGHKKSGT